LIKIHPYLNWKEVRDHFLFFFFFFFLARLSFLKQLKQLAQSSPCLLKLIWLYRVFQHSASPVSSVKWTETEKPKRKPPKINKRKIKHFQQDRKKQTAYISQFIFLNAICVSSNPVPTCTTNVCSSYWFQSVSVFLRKWTIATNKLICHLCYSRIKSLERDHLKVQSSNQRKPRLQICKVLFCVEGKAFHSGPSHDPC